MKKHLDLIIQAIYYVIIIGAAVGFYFFFKGRTLGTVSTGGSNALSCSAEAKGLIKAERTGFMKYCNGEKFIPFIQNNFRFCRKGDHFFVRSDGRASCGQYKRVHIKIAMENNSWVSRYRYGNAKSFKDMMNNCKPDEKECKIHWAPMHIGFFANLCRVQGVETIGKLNKVAYEITNFEDSKMIPKEYGIENMKSIFIGTFVAEKAPKKLKKSRSFILNLKAECYFPERN